MTLRARLTLVYLLALAVIGAAISGVTYIAVSQHLHSQSARAATALARAAAAVAEPTDVSLDRLSGSGDTVWLTDTHGRVVAHTVGATGTTLADLRASAARALSHGYVAAFETRSSGGFAVVLHSTHQVDETLSTLAWTLIFTNVAGLAIAAIAGTLLARQALRPVDRMREEADQIRGDQLDRRIPEGGDDELGRLAHAFNQLLARAQAASDQEARFVADASHELRTPITAIEGYSRVILRAAGGGDLERVRESAEIVARESRRMARVLRELLLLAQSEAAPTPLAPTRLDVVVVDALQEARAIAPDRHFDVSVSHSFVAGDADRLREMATVLLDNATKYSPADATIDVGTQTLPDGTVRLWIRDRGVGLTEVDRERVFDRFARGSASHGVSGSGLGLPIAKAIADRHRAEFDLRPAPGGGTIADVRFPPVRRRPADQVR